LELAPSNIENEEPYRVTLGKRHRVLRENYLELKPKQMTDFYKFEQVSHLEACEKGDDEFPRKIIDKLVETFFIDQNYLDEGYPPIFRRFVIDSNEINHLFDQGFMPSPSNGLGQEPGKTFRAAQALVVTQLTVG